MALLRPRDWSLRARLTGVIVVLLFVTSVVIGGVMFFVVKQSQVEEFDNDVSASIQGSALALSQSGDDTRDGGRPLAAQTIVLAQSGLATQAFVVDASGGHTALKSAQVEAIQGLPSGVPQTVEVPGYGEYRFISYPVGFGGQLRITSGLPMSILQQRVAGILTTIAVVVLAAIVLAAICAAVIVGRALRPLKRVAGIATDVSRMRLERGDVELAERVPESDTNPHTEVGQVGLALNNLLDSVGSALVVRQASEEKVRHFVADASHELRTPLASIRGYAELTRRFGGDLGETVAHNIDRIESESKRMTSLVEDLLLLARLDSQRELDELEVDLSRMLVDVVSDAYAAGRDHVWDVEIPDEPVLVIGDEARLQQVFTNLLANARVHTPAGTQVSVELREPRDGEVVVVVRDSGPGIPPDLRPTMFERFVRGDSSRNRGTGSTGLGLSIVSAVTQAHHGSVTVESEPGNTAFTVRLPAAPVAKAVWPAPVAT